MVMATEVDKEIEAIPLVKDLASSEASVRRKNLQQILSHLEQRSPSNHLTQTQALQLWRGFHVSLYMHDSKNQLSVQTLIATLASTFKIIRSKDFQNESNPSSSTVNSKSQTSETETGEDEFSGFDNEDATAETPEPDNSWLAIYSTAFWETIAREWSSVDQWRMNKYLLLIRFVLRELFTITLTSYFNLETEQVHETESTEQDQTTVKSKKRKGDATGKDVKAKKSKTSTSAARTSTSTPSQPKTPNLNPLKSQLAILTLHPLSPRNRKVSDGLRLHVLDIYLDELLTAAKSLPTDAVSIEELRRLIREEFMVPIKGVAADGLAKHVRVKAKEVLGEVEERSGEVV